MAAAICYGVRGGGAQLCFHVTAGNYNTDTLIDVLGLLRARLDVREAGELGDAGLQPPGRNLHGHRGAGLRAALRHRGRLDVAAE